MTVQVRQEIREFLLSRGTSFRLLFKNIKVKLYRTIIWPVVLYRYEPWSRTLREEHRLRAFENWVLKRLVMCTAHQILFW